MIGFNPKFLVDALRIIDDEEVTLYMMNPKSPCFIRDEGRKLYIPDPSGQFQRAHRSGCGVKKG